MRMGQRPLDSPPRSGSNCMSRVVDAMIIPRVNSTYAVGTWGTLVTTGWCVAGRSATIIGTRAAPTATTTHPTIATTTSVFGLCAVMSPADMSWRLSQLGSLASSTACLTKLLNDRRVSAMRPLIAAQFWQHWRSFVVGWIGQLPAGGVTH
jgi:hypothetical protein